MLWELVSELRSDPEWLELLCRDEEVMLELKEPGREGLDDLVGELASLYC